MIQPKIPHLLLDTIKDEHDFVTDADLASALGLTRAQVCQLRYGVARISSTVILKIHEKLHVPVARIRQLAAQNNRM